MSFIYRRLISVADKLVPASMAPAWNHAAGPKTIFFWAPTMKWEYHDKRIRQIDPDQSLALRAQTFLQRLLAVIIGRHKALVIAGIGDIARPAEKLSLSQSSALAATGTIWARYSLVIIPKNYNLFFVNVFVAATGIYQLTRIYNYRRGHPDYD